MSRRKKEKQGTCSITQEIHQVFVSITICVFWLAMVIFPTTVAIHLWLSLHLVLATQTMTTMRTSKTLNSDSKDPNQSRRQGSHWHKAVLAGSTSFKNPHVTSSMFYALTTSPRWRGPGEIVVASSQCVVLKYMPPKHLRTPLLSPVDSKASRTKKLQVCKSSCPYMTRR